MNNLKIDVTESVILEAPPLPALYDKTIIIDDENPKELIINEENQDHPVLMVIDQSPVVDQGVDILAEVKASEEPVCEELVKTTSELTLKADEKVRSEATSAGDGHVTCSSEDSENECLDGEQPKKKRKLNYGEAKEEDRITQEWDNDMKLIKKNLGRISRLFEVYDGYKTKRNPLLISSDLIIQEPILIQENITKDKISELAKSNVPTNLVLSASCEILKTPPPLFKTFQEGTIPLGNAKGGNFQRSNTTKEALNVEKLV
jgi:hypothetical protein